MQQHRDPSGRQQSEQVQSWGTEMILPITKAQQHSIKTMQRKKKLQKNRDDSKGKS